MCLCMWDCNNRFLGLTDCASRHHLLLLPHCWPSCLFFCVPQLYLWGSPFFFFVCVPQLYLWGSYSSSSASPAISLGFTILLLLHPQLYLWSSPSSSSASPDISLGFTFFFFCVPQLYLWGSPFFFFCVPSYISGVHLSSSSSAFPAMSVGFTILLLYFPSYYLWGSPSSSSSTFLSYISWVHLLLLCSPAISLGFTFFCIPSFISGVRHSSSSAAFQAMSLGFTFFCVPSCILGFTFFFCIPSYISEIHNSSSFPNYYLWGSPSSSAFPSYISGVHLLLLPSPAISLWLNFLLLHSQLYLWCSPFFFFFCVPQLYLGFTIWVKFLHM